jgi:hypothetical protein
MASSLTYKDSSVGLTVAFDFASEILRLNFNDNIWFAIARVLLKGINKAILTPIRHVIFHVNQFRETISIEWEKSKANIRAGKLVEVTKIYEKHKSEVDSLSLTSEAKQKLIRNLDIMLDKHVAQIIEMG